jgi:hypothetical protein
LPILSPEWIDVTERSPCAAKVWSALRNDTILAEARPSPHGTPVFVPPSIRRDAIFIGEPGFPNFHGRTVAGMVWALVGWWDITLNRAEVEA